MDQFDATLYSVEHLEHLTMFLPFGYKLMIIFSTLKTDCSELGLGWYRETSLSPPVICLLTVPRRYFICGSFFYLYLSLQYCLVCVLQYYGHMLGKGCFLGSPVCGVLLFFLSLSHTVSWVRYGT